MKFNKYTLVSLASAAVLGVALPSQVHADEPSEALTQISDSLASKKSEKTTIESKLADLSKQYTDAVAAGKNNEAPEAVEARGRAFQEAVNTLTADLSKKNEEYLQARNANKSEAELTAIEQSGREIQVRLSDAQKKLEQAKKDYLESVELNKIEEEGRPLQERLSLLNQEIERLEEQLGRYNKTSQLSIQVVDTEGRKPEGVEVDVLIDGKSMTLKTDVNGVVQLTALNGQTVRYRLAQTPVGFETPKEGMIQLAPGANQATILVQKNKTEVPAATATLSIQVVDTQGRKPEGVVVDVMVNGVAINVASTDKDGKVLVRNLKEGDQVSYRLASVPVGFELPVPGSVKLNSGENQVTISVTKLPISTNGEASEEPALPEGKVPTEQKGDFETGKANEEPALPEGKVPTEPKEMNTGKKDSSASPARVPVVPNAKSDSSKVAKAELKSLPNTGTKENDATIVAGVFTFVATVLGFGYVGRHERKK